MPKRFFILLVLVCAPLGVSAQDAPAASVQKPTEHILGTITSLDSSAQTVTVKDDKAGTEQVVELAGTKTLLKVAPGAKDLKSASRITAGQLAAGDRVDIRGFKASDDASKIAARSVVLMSARDLEAAHEAQAQEWQNSQAGRVSEIDTASGRITIRERTPQGPQQATLQTSGQTEFTRYSPEQPTTPMKSTIAQIQSGDQVRVLGDAGPDGTITVRKIYSGAFRTYNGAVVSIAPDGKQFTIKNLADKKPVQISLNEATTIRKLPPEMAAGLAHRMGGGGGGHGPSSPEPAANPTHRGGGDISQMIERLPAISLSDLKPGDAVVVSGALEDAGSDHLLATHIVAGVEPVLQSAPARQRSGSGSDPAGGDWGLGEISVPQR